MKNTSFCAENACSKVISLNRISFSLHKLTDWTLKTKTQSVSFELIEGILRLQMIYACIAWLMWNKVHAYVKVKPQSW